MSAKLPAEMSGAERFTADLFFARLFDAMLRYQVIWGRFDELQRAVSLLPLRFKRGCDTTLRSLIWQSMQSATSEDRGTHAFQSPPRLCYRATPHKVSETRSFLQCNGSAWRGPRNRASLVVMIRMNIISSSVLSVGSSYLVSTTFVSTIIIICRSLLL